MTHSGMRTCIAGRVRCFLLQACAAALLPSLHIPMSLPQVSFGYRLMGFGHRVYKTYDPRAKIMKKVCDQVLEHVGIR